MDGIFYRFQNKTDAQGLVGNRGGSERTVGIGNSALESGR